MDLLELDELIHDLKYDASAKELTVLLQRFQADFYQVNFYVDDAKMKVIWTPSRVEGFENYPETFVHLITRKSNAGKRVFDKYRANKIHWVKCILENKDEPEVIYFQFPEKDGELRDYYWFKEGDFLVIIKKVLPDCLIVTSFNIDDDRNKKYFEKKYQWYVKNRA
jgi:hypothetical protein